MPKKFMDYFDTEIEFPGNDIPGGNILPIGTAYTYISDSFLNGLVNYSGEIIKAYVLPRNKAWKEPFSQPTIFHESNKPIECKSKHEVYNYILTHSIYHTNLHAFQDDVALLTKVKYSNIYWYFWFDCDVSDGSIGRFSSNDDENLIIEEFTKHFQELILYDNYSDTNLVELPMNFFKGWLSF